MINLEKGQRVTIELSKFTIGLGWDTNQTDTGFDFDLDASAFILGENKKILADEYFVFYNNLKSPDGSVEHTGDNLTGEGEGDDESIRIDLTRIDPRATEICFVVTIHQAAERRQNFGQVRNSFIRIYNSETGEEIARYDLEEDFSVETAVEFGRLYKKNGQWRFEAMGVGYKHGLDKFLEKYN
ncbi:MAG: TerD family protein [Bacteroides sp.]|nr:TerD family protein [Bacteroides sp.]MCM1456275.1 TerD family protein [Lachnoclostridium sp.]